jgi:hypothetical protein
VTFGFSTAIRSIAESMSTRREEIVLGHRVPPDLAQLAVLRIGDPLRVDFLDDGIDVSYRAKLSRFEAV